MLDTSISNVAFVTMRRSRTIIAVCILALTVVFCSSSPVSTATTQTQQDYTGLVGIASGRKMFAKSRGSGVPTVVLIAGKGNGAEDWLQVLDPADPLHDTSGDDVASGMGKLHRSDDAVFPSVARFTRVITYDRPDIRFDAADITTPRKQPHTVELDVSDLHALLIAMGEPGPFVLVAHSYGGLIATLYARIYPKDIAGLVMVDTVSELMEAVVSPRKLQNWDASNSAISSQVREGVRLIDAFKQINAAPPLPKVPAIVLSADKPWRIDLLPPEIRHAEMVTFTDWLASHKRLTAALVAEHITKTTSGHDIYLYNSALVVAAIRKVVNDVHLQKTSTAPRE